VTATRLHPPPLRPYRQSTPTLNFPRAKTRFGSKRTELSPGRVDNDALIVSTLDQLVNRPGIQICDVPDAWAQNGGRGWQEFVDDPLVVHNGERTHRKLSSLLELLRKRASEAKNELKTP